MSNIISSDQQITFSIFTGVPGAARALIWEVFFASRQRGIDLPTHFPWIEQNVGTYCLTLSQTNGGRIIATLVLRKNNPFSGINCAMIGMVCVDQSWRRRGLSSQLLASVLNLAAEQQINSLVLWTGQPNIYSRHGFVPDNCDSFGRVTLNYLRPHAQVRFAKRYTDTARSLPPFAQQLICFESDKAELIGVETVQGMALAEWKGDLTAVLDLIEAALPKTWNLNAPTDATIFDEIRRRGHDYSPLFCAKRMVRHLDTPVYIPYISVLDRI